MTNRLFGRRAPVRVAAFAVGTALLATHGAFAGQIGSGITKQGPTGGAIAALKRQSKDLLLVGPIENLNASAGTVTVLGQVVRVGDVRPFADLAANRVPVAVYGKTLSSGEIQARAAAIAGSAYVDGANAVYLRGVLTSVDAATGIAKIGKLSVDFTAALAELDATAMVPGTIVELVGSRPLAKGSVSADVVGVLGQIGSGINGQIGSGINGQIGSGINGQIGSGINGQIGSGINGQIGSGINGQIGSGINGQIGSGINGQIGSGINGQMSGVREAINGQIGSGINGQIGSGVVNGQIVPGVDGQEGSG